MISLLPLESNERSRLGGEGEEEEGGAMGTSKKETDRQLNHLLVRSLQKVLKTSTYGRIES